MEEYMNGLPDRIMELKLGIAGLMLNVNNDPQAECQSEQWEEFWIKLDEEEGT